jgi:hypothetical protein
VGEQAALGIVGNINLYRASAIIELIGQCGVRIIETKRQFRRLVIRKAKSLGSMACL